jgi:hypothetical protein
MTREFIHDLPDDEAQPYEVHNWGSFIAVQQWDGTGEFEHCLLIPVNEVESFINQIRNAELNH